jgi:hypothetical protein
MSLTIDNNRLAQQRALPTQLTTAQSNTAAPAAPAATTATANQAAALISGNAGLTSDLLSVLLQEQSGASTGSASGPGLTLAGMLDAQDQAQAQQTQTDSITGLDPSAAAQSATSTDSVRSGLQDLLSQLAL